MRELPLYLSIVLIFLVHSHEFVSAFKSTCKVPMTRQCNSGVISTQYTHSECSQASHSALWAKKKGGKITPNEGESMEEYRKSILNIIKNSEPDDRKLGGREILNLLINKWGAAYDLQIRKNAPFGEESANVYINVMWQYFGQKSFRMEEREYLEHLEAIGRYVTSINRVTQFRDAIAESRKRPNAYFGYAVGIPLDVKPETADKFFKDLPYE